MNQSIKQKEPKRHKKGFWIKHNWAIIFTNF